MTDFEVESTEAHSFGHTGGHSAKADYEWQLDDDAWWESVSATLTQQQQHRAQEQLQ